MKLPKNVFESKEVIEFLEKRSLINQYKKAKIKVII